MVGIGIHTTPGVGHLFIMAVGFNVQATAGCGVLMMSGDRRGCAGAITPATAAGHRFRPAPILPPASAGRSMARRSALILVLDWGHAVSLFATTTIFAAGIPLATSGMTAMRIGSSIIHGWTTTGPAMRITTSLTTASIRHGSNRQLTGTSRKYPCATFRTPPNTPAILGRRTA